MNLLHIFNISLQCSVFPQEWKTHKICPIPKKGDLSNVQNYRPISLLCTMSKVFERAVYDQIISFIRPKIANCQFGFMQKRSCLTALLSSYNHIVNSIDNNKATDVIYLDLQKAFDSVPHQELLFKLWPGHWASQVHFGCGLSPTSLIEPIMCLLEILIKPAPGTLWSATGKCSGTAAVFDIYK